MMQSPTVLAVTYVTNGRNETVAFRNETVAFRNETVAFRNETVTFRNETVAFRNETVAVPTVIIKVECFPGHFIDQLLASVRRMNDLSERCHYECARKS